MLVNGGTVVVVVTVTVDVEIVLISVDGVVVVAGGDLLIATSLTPFPFCLPFTISASFGLPSSETVGGRGGGGGIMVASVVGNGGKLTGAKSSLGWGRFKNLCIIIIIINTCCIIIIPVV